MKKIALCLGLYLLLIALVLPAAEVFALDEEIVYLGTSDRQKLLSVLGGGLTESGKKYVLLNDFTFSASEFSDAWLPGDERPERAQYAVLLSSFDGNGKTITVNVGQNQSARPIFHNIGSYYSDEITVCNLTVQYKGDVKVAAFMSGMARNAVFSDINLFVDGDIVASADYFGDNVDFYAHGFGYSAEDCVFRNISLSVGENTGGIIGQTSKTISERLAYGYTDSATFACGFFHEMENVSISKVDIFARQINATGDAGAVAAGFAFSIISGIGGSVKDVTVSVKDSILAKQQSDGTEVVSGAYGFARLFDSLSGALITVGSISIENKNLLSTDNFLTEAAGFGGVGAAGAGKIFGNTLRVNGNITASSAGLLSVSGGYLSRGEVFSTSKNIVEVLGNITAKGASLAFQTPEDPDALIVSGFSHGDASVNASEERLFISGIIRADAEEKSGITVSGFVVGGGNISRSTALIGGISAKAAGGPVSVSGFSDGFGEEAEQKNNYIRIDGNLEAAGDGSVSAAGYSSGFISEEVTVSDSTVNIKGNIKVSAAVEAPDIAANGFAGGVSGGKLLMNTAVISGNIEISANASKNAVIISGAFAGEAVEGEIINNAVLMTGDISVEPSARGSIMKSDFTALLNGAKLTGNAIFGPPGLDRSPKEFLVGALRAGASGYTVSDNVYIAMLGDERVSHPIDFVLSGGKVTITPKELTKPLPVLTTRMKTAEEYEISDRLSGTLSFSENQTGLIKASGGSNSVTLTRKSLMGSSEDLLPLVTVYSKSGGRIVVRDIVGIQSVQPKTISGTVFYDNNNNGRYDTGDSYTPSVTIDISVKGDVVKTVTTDSVGRYAFSPPLISALSEDYSLKIKMPENYTASKHSVNKFRDGTAVISELKYNINYENINGALAVPVVYTVDFVVNGGSSVGAQRVYEGSKVVKPADPLREGYIFGGWFSDSGFSKQYEFQNPLFENLKLYAKWVIMPDSIAFSVSYDGNGSTGGRVPDTVVYEVGDAVEISHISPAREGFEFIGWKSGYNDTVYKAGETFKMPSSDVRLTALWEGVESTYTVLFDTAGGSEIKEISGVRYGARITEPDPPVKSAYTFDGWFSDEKYRLEWDFGNDIVIDDITLHAKWDYNGAATFDPGESGMPLDNSAFPLSGIESGRWGLSNLIFTVCCALLSVMMAVKAVKRYKPSEQSKSIVRILLSFLSIAVAITAVIFFLATADFMKGAAVIDRWTWVMVLLAAAQIIFLAGFKTREKESQQE